MLGGSGFDAVCRLLGSANFLSNIDPFFTLNRLISDVWPGSLNRKA